MSDDDKPFLDLNDHRAVIATLDRFETQARRAENYRVALEKIAEIARVWGDQEILEIAEDALAEDMQLPAKADAQLATDLHFEEL
jgi:hypothetical protein